jgi:hypothetical protein
MNIKKKISLLLAKDISLIFLFSLFLKNKILTFLSIILAFLIIFTFTNTEKTNKQIASAKIRVDIPYSVILRVKNYNPNSDIQIYSERALQLKISSYKNFVEFTNENNNKYFLQILQKYNLDLKTFFKKEFSEINKSENISEYSLNYPKEIDGRNFLDNYIKFSKKKLKEEIYSDLIFYINLEIKRRLNALEIAKDLNIEEPLKKTSDFNYKEYDFNKGKKVLSAEISQLEKEKKSLSENYLDWDPFIVESVELESYLPKTTIYSKFFLKIIFSFFLGFLLAFLIIFFKNNNKNN